jgi:hypothetical protein
MSEVAPTTGATIGMSPSGSPPLDATAVDYIPAAKRNQTKIWAISLRRSSTSREVVDVVTVASAQSPDFVVVVTPFTELTETLHEEELLESQPALFVVVVTPFTEVTETLHEDELCTATLLDTLLDWLVETVPESPADACPSATNAPIPPSAASASSATALRIPTPQDDVLLPEGYALPPSVSTAARSPRRR